MTQGSVRCARRALDDSTTCHQHAPGWADARIGPTTAARIAAGKDWQERRRQIARKIYDALAHGGDLGQLRRVVARHEQSKP